MHGNHVGESVQKLERAKSLPVKPFHCN